MLAGTYTWWHVYYTEVAQELARIWGSRNRQAVSSQEFISCLYSENHDQCNRRGSSGQRPPVILFWLSVATVMTGFILAAAGNIAAAKQPPHSHQ